MVCSCLWILLGRKCNPCRIEPQQLPSLSPQIFCPSPYYAALPWFWTSAPSSSQICMKMALMVCRLQFVYLSYLFWMVIYVWREGKLWHLLLSQALDPQLPWFEVFKSQSFSSILRCLKQSTCKVWSSKNHIGIACLGNKSALRIFLK